MNRLKIQLTTQSDVVEFVRIANTESSSIYLEHGEKFSVDAKSLMGVLYGVSDFKDLYVSCEDVNVLNKFNKFTA